MDTTTSAQKATNQGKISDGNSAFGSATQNHHARQLHTGKRKSAADVAGTKPCKSVKVESPVKSGASAVAAAGAATENIAELRDFESDFSSEEHQPATVNTKKKVDVSNNACTFTWGQLCPGAPDMKVRIDPKAIGSLLNVTLFGWVPPAYRPAALLRTTLADSMRDTGSHRVSRIYGSVKLSIKLCGQQLKEHEFWLSDMVPAIVAGGELLKKLPALALGEASQAQLNHMYRAYKYPEERIAPVTTQVPALSSQAWILPAPEKTQPQQPPASCPVASSALETLNSVYRPRPIVVARVSAAAIEAVIPTTVNQFSVTTPVLDEQSLL